MSKYFTTPIENAVKKQIELKFYKDKLLRNIEHHKRLLQEYQNAVDKTNAEIIDSDNLLSRLIAKENEMQANTN